MSTNIIETLKNLNRSFRRQGNFDRFTIRLSGGRKLIYSRRPRVRASRLLYKIFMLASVPAFALDPNALPTGGNIVAGSGGINSAGNQMTVTQSSQNMVVNWGTFNIGEKAGVAFKQPGADAAALNRVNSVDPSYIMGSLTGNGRVFLVNPNGIVFGSGAHVDVSGLVASTLDIKNSDFMSGKFIFEKNGTAGKIINEGTINVGEKGFAAFLAPEIINQGLITAKLGTVAMAAGDKVTLDIKGDGLISFTINKAAMNALVEQKGMIHADGGSVILGARSAGDLAATVVNNEGIIEANSVTERNGVIILDGGDQGIVQSSGTLAAKGIDSGLTGGQVKMLGNRVGLLDGGIIDVSGSAGGGEVLIGGNFQGKGPEANAQVAYVAQGASIKANAVDNGNGGKVIVWADDTTRFYGSIEAKGGANGGDGGFVETSGKGYLDFQGAVDTRAAKGKAGTLLLDPTNITIQASGADTNISVSNGTWSDASGNGTSILTVASLEASLANTSAVVSTNSSANQSGIITVQDSIAWSSANSLTLDASSNLSSGAIQLNAGITGSNSSANLILQSGAGGIASNASGVINMGGSVALNTTGVIAMAGAMTAGGNITLVNSTSATFGAVSADTVALSAASGTVTFGGNLVAQNLTTTSSVTNVSLTGAVNTIANAVNFNNTGTLQIGDASTDSTTFNGGVNTNAVGSTVSLAGTVKTTNGSASFGNTVTLMNQTVLNSSGTLSIGNVTGGSNNLTINSGDLVTLNSINTTETLMVNSGGAINQQTGVIVAGAVNLSAATGIGNTSILNTQSANITALTQSGNVNVSNTDQSSPVAVNLNVASGAGDINFVQNNSTALNIAGLNTANGSIAVTFANVSNVSVIGNVTAAGAGSDVSFVRTNTSTVDNFNVVNANINATDVLSVNLGGNGGNIITSGSSVLTANTVNLTASGGVTANTAAANINVNTWTGSVAIANTYNSGTTVNIVDAADPDSSNDSFSQTGSDVTFSGISNANSNGSLQITGSNNVSFSGTLVTGGSLNVTARNNIDATSALNVTGTASFNSNVAGNILLNNASNALGTVAFTTSSGNVSVVSSNSLTVACSSIAGNFTANTSGQIGQSGVLTVTGTSNFVAGANQVVYVDNTSNLFGGAVSANARTSTLKGVKIGNDQAIVLGSISVGSDGVQVVANGTITQTGAILSTGGPSTFTAGAGNDIILNNSGNLFGNHVGFTNSKNVTLVDSGAVALWNTTAISGFLDVKAQSITQGVSQTLDVAGSATFNATAGAITLTNTSNTLNTVSLAATAGATIVNNQTLTLGESKITGALAANVSNGDIVQTGALNVSGAATFNATGGSNVTLGNTSNVFGGSVTFASAGTLNNVTVADSTDFDIGALSVSNTLNVTSAGGNITNSGALIANAATFTAVNKNVTVNNAGNNFGTVGFTAGNVTVVDSNGLNLSTSVITGALSATATAGDITQAGSVNATTATFTAVGNNVTLDNASNDFGKVGFTAGNVTVVDGSGLNISASTITGTLSASAISGGITQNGLLNVSGSATFNAAGGSNVTLGNTSNVFGGSVTFASAGTLNNVTVADSTDFDIGALSVSNTLNVTSAGGNITNSGALIANAATFTAVNKNVTVNNAGNNFGTVGFTAGNVTVVDSNGLNLSTSVITGALSATATAGDITQAGSVNATTATFTAVGNNVTLDNASNDFGKVGFTAGNVTVTDVNAINLSASSIDNNLIVTSGGTVTQNGALSVGNEATFNSGVYDISLTKVANNFNKVGFTGANVTVYDGDAINLTASTVSGNFVVNAFGDVTQNGALDVNGTTTISAQGSNIDLTASNTLVGAVSLYNPGSTAGNISLVNNRDLLMGSVTMLTTGNGSLSLSANGNLSQISGASIASGTGDVSLKAASGANITLTNSNEFNGDVSLSTFDGTGNIKNVSIKDGSAFAIQAGLNITGDLALSAGGDITDLGAMTVGGITSLTTTAGNGNINLDGPNTYTGAVNLATQGTGSVAISSVVSELALANLSVGGSLTVSGTQNITDTAGGTRAVTGATSLTTTANNASITLDHGGVYSGVVNASTNGAGNFTLTGVTSALNLGTISTNNLNVSSSQGISDTGILTVAGTSYLATTANSAAITLDSANVFGGAVNVSTNGTGATSITNVPGNLTFDSATFGGAFTAEAGNLTIQSSGFSGQSGIVTLNATGALVQTGAILTKGGTVNMNAATVTTNASGTITTTSNTNTASNAGSVNINTSGDIALGGFINTVGSNSTTLQAGQGGTVIINSNSGNVSLVGIDTTGGSTTSPTLIGATAGSVMITVAPGKNVTLHENISAVGGSGATGQQSGGNVYVFGDAILANNIKIDTGATDGNIKFNNTINSPTTPYNLTLNAGTGNIDFISTVGATNPLNVLAITSAKNVTAADTINAASVNQSAGTGTTMLNGTVTTTTAAGVSITTNTINQNANINTSGSGTVTQSATSITIANGKNINADGAVNISGSSSVTTGGNITTTNDNVSISGNTITLNENISINTGIGIGNIAFSGNSFTGANQTLSLASGEGNINFGSTSTNIQDISINNTGATNPGNVTQSGCITATNLAIVNAGSVTLNNADNAITNLGNVSTTGAFALFDNGGLNLTGASNVGTSGTGAYTLTSRGGILNIAAQNITANGTVSLTGDGVTQSSGSIVNAGSNQIVIDGGYTGTGDAINLAGNLTTTSTSATAVVITDATTVVVGNVSVLSGTLSFSDISGTVTQNSGSVIKANTVNASTCSTVSLTGSNQIDNLGTISTAGNLVVNDVGGGLNLTGNISTQVNSDTSGSVTLTTSGGALALGNQTITTNNGVTLTGQGVTSSSAGVVQGGDGGSVVVNASGGNIALAGTVVSGCTSTPAITFINANDVALGTVTASAGGVTLGTTGTERILGNVTQTGVLTVATTLTGNTTGAVTLNTQNNNVTNLGAFTTNGTLSLKNTVSNLTMTGDLNTGVGGVDLNASAGYLLMGSQNITAGGAVSLTGSGGIVTGGGEITTTNDDVAFNSATTLTGDLSVNTSVGGSAGGNISFTTVQGTANNTESLTLNAGQGGNISASGGVGSTTTLKNLTIVEAGNATFASTVAVGTDVTITNATGTIAFQGNLSANDLVVNAGAYNVSLTGANNNITSQVDFLNSGTTTLGDATSDVNLFVGGVNATAGAVNAAGTIQTTNNTLALGNTTIASGQSLTLNSGNGTGDITVASISGVNGGTAENVTLISGAGLTTVTGAIGTGIGTLVLQDNTATSTGAVSLQGNVSVTNLTTYAQNYNVSLTGANNSISDATTFANLGTLKIGDNDNDTTAFVGGLTVTAPSSVSTGGTISVTSGQMILGDSNTSVTLVANTTLSTSNQNITVAVVNANNTGLESLTVAAGTGNANMTGNIGISNALLSVDISGANVTLHNVTTSGTQSYTASTGTITTNSDYISNGSAITFNGSTVLNSNTLVQTTVTGNASAGGEVTFNGTIASTANSNLNITSGAGNINLLGAVANLTNRLGNVVLNSDGTTLIDSTLAANTLTTSAGGTTQLNGDVTTTTSQLYADNVTLIGDVVSTAGTTVTFNQKVDGNKNLTVTTSGLTTFGGEVGNTTALASLTTNGDGVTAINGGLVNTTGAQLYSDNVTLNATSNATTVQSAGGTIEFAGTVNGGAANQSLTVTTSGLTTFGGEVGNTTALASLTANSETRVNGGLVNTTGSQIYNGNLTVGVQDALFASSSFTTATNKTITAGNHNLTITTDAINLGGSVSGNQSLTIQPRSNTTTVGIGDGAVGALNLTTTEIGYLQDGFTNITIGSATGNAAVNITTATFKDPLIVRTSQDGADASITQTGTLSTGYNNTTQFGSITLTTNATNIGGDIRTYGQTIAVNAGAAGVNISGGQLATQSALTLSDTRPSGAININTINNGSINVSGTLNAAGVDYASGLAGDGGQVNITANGSGTIRVSNISTSGGNGFGGGNASSISLHSDSGQITLAGTNITAQGGLGRILALDGYGGNVNISSPAILETNVTVVTKGIQGGNVDFAKVDGNKSLTILAGSGNVSMNGNVGVDSSLLFVNISGADVSLHNVTTSGYQKYAATGNISTHSSYISNGSDITFAGNTIINDDTLVLTTGTGASGGNILFNGTVNSNASGFNDLTLTAGTGNVTVAGAIGNNVSIGDLTVSSSNVTNLMNVAASSMAVTGTTIDLNGQTYTALNGGATFTGATVLNQTGGLTTVDTSAANGSIVFTGTINDNAAGDNTALTLTANRGNVTVTGDIGNSQPIGTLTVSSSNVTNLMNVAASSMAVTGTTIDLNGTNYLATAGNATFTGATNLTSGAATLVDATNIAFNGTGTIVGTNDLTLTPNASGTVLVAGTTNLTGGGTFNVSQGASTTVQNVSAGNITISSYDINLNGSNYLASGDATFTGNTRLTIADVDVDASNITFFGSVNAAPAMPGANLTLTANNVTGQVEVTGSVGNAGYFGDFTVTSANTTTVRNIDATNIDITSDAINLRGISYQASQDATFTGATYLTVYSGSRVSIGASNINFNGAGTIDSSSGNSLILSASNDIAVLGAIGSAGSFGNLTIDTAHDVLLNNSVQVASLTQVVGTGTTFLEGAVTTTSRGVNLNGANLVQNSTVDSRSTVTYNMSDEVTIASRADITARGNVDITATNGISTGGNVTTTGNSYVAFNSATELTDNVTVSTGVGGEGGIGDITFASTLDGAYNLTLNSAGTEFFNGEVGRNVALASITTDAPGSVALNGGFVNTTGAQTYNDQATLGVNNLLTGTNITFGSTIDGTQALTIVDDGSTILAGTIGGTNQLTNLTVDTAGGLVMPSTYLSQNLDLTTGGSVTQNGSASTMYVGGTTHINANGYAITLDNASNDFVGTVGQVGEDGAGLLGTSITLRDANSLYLGQNQATAGAVTMTANQSIYDNLAGSVTNIISTTASTLSGINGVVGTFAAPLNVNVPSLYTYAGGMQNEVSIDINGNVGDKILHLLNVPPGACILNGRNVCGKDVPGEDIGFPVSLAYLDQMYLSSNGYVYMTPPRITPNTLQRQMYSSEDNEVASIYGPYTYKFAPIVKTKNRGVKLPAGVESRADSNNSEKEL